MMYITLGMYLYNAAVDSKQLLFLKFIATVISEWQELNTIDLSIVFNLLQPSCILIHPRNLFYYWG